MALLAAPAVSEQDSLRLAYLVEAGVSPAALPATSAEITARFDDARRHEKPGRPFWWPTTIVTLAVGALAALVVFSLWRASRPGHAELAAGARAVAPGAPRVGAVLEPRFAPHLPRLWIALDAWGANARPTDRATDSAPVADAANQAIQAAHSLGLPPATAARLETLVALAEAVPNSGDDPAPTTAFMAGVAALDDDLAADGLAYFLDADVLEILATKRRRVLVYAFRVESIHEFRTPSGPVRALAVHRLDKLNAGEALLGLTRPSLRDAMILVDEVDQDLANRILPALAPEGRLTLTDPDERGQWRDDVETHAAAAIREELLAAAPKKDEARRVGDLLARRKALFDKWQALAAEKSMFLREPGLIIDDPGAALAGLASPEELRELDSINGELDTLHDTVTRLRDVTIASVARHEVHHRLEFDQPDRKAPEEVVRLAGPAHLPDGNIGPGLSARDELSAYLSQLARYPALPKTLLTLLARHALYSGAPQPEAVAAVVVLEGLARQLAMPPAILVTSRQIDRPRAAQVYLALLAVPSDQLRAAAGRLWAELFGAPLPALEEVTLPAP